VTDRNSKSLFTAHDLLTNSIQLSTIMLQAISMVGGTTTNRIRQESNEAPVKHAG